MYFSRAREVTFLNPILFTFYLFLLVRYITIGTGDDR